MNKNLRLFLWEMCHRRCEGCCNKQWDIAHLPVVDPGEYEGYKKVLLTGGEPMIYPKRVIQVIDEIRSHAPSWNTEDPIKIIMYTAKIDDLPMLFWVLGLLDGITLTLHTKEDVQPFIKLTQELLKRNIDTKMMYRLNVFKEVGETWEMEGFRSWMLRVWHIKTGIEWIDPCPLPEREHLKRWEE